MSIVVWIYNNKSLVIVVYIFKLFYNLFFVKIKF